MHLPPPKNGNYYDAQEYDWIKNSGDPQLQQEFNWYVQNKQAEQVWGAQQAEIDKAKGPGTTETLLGGLAAPAGTLAGMYVANRYFAKPDTTASLISAITGKPPAAGASGIAQAAESVTTPAAVPSSAVPSWLPEWMGGSPAASSAAPSLVQVGTNIDGTPMMASSVAPEAAGSWLGSAAPYLGGATAALGAYDLVKNFGRSDPLHSGMSGAAVLGGLSQIPSLGITSALTGALPFLAGLGPLAPLAIGGILGAGLGAFKTTGKPESQKSRDDIRKQFQRIGLTDKNWNVGNFNIGKEDPLAPSPFSGKHLYDINQENVTEAGMHVAVGGEALGHALAPGGDAEATSQMGRSLANAAFAQGGNAMDNLRAFAQQTGIDYNTALAQLSASPSVDPSKKAAFANALSEVYGVNKPQFDYSTPNLIKSGGAPATPTTPAAVASTQAVQKKLLWNAPQGIQPQKQQSLGIIPQLGGQSPAPLIPIRPGTPSSGSNQQSVNVSAGNPALNQGAMQSAGAGLPSAPQASPSGREAMYRRAGVPQPVGFNKVDFYTRRKQQSIERMASDPAVLRLATVLAGSRGRNG